MARRGKRRKNPKSRRPPLCPHCGSAEVLKVVYGLPGPGLQRAIRRGEVVLDSSLEWEGMPEWRCRGCGCEWRGGWMKFSRL